MSRLVFFGNERIATAVTTTAPVLQALLAAGHEVMAVVVAQEASAHSRKQRPLEVAAIAERNDIPLLAPAKLSEIKVQLESYKAEAGILAAYGKLVPQTVINIFPKGIVNLHPSLLPAHRGSIPLEATLLAGDAQTGVSLMQLVREMDAGPVFTQQAVRLAGTETKQALADQLLELGKIMLLESLASILDGSLQPTPQAAEGVSYDQRLAKAAGLIGPADWNQPAAVIERKVRALAGWPRVRTTIGASEVIITKAHVATGTAAPGTIWIENKEVGIHALDGVLVFDKLIPAGKKEMSGHDFLLGYKVT